MTGDTWLRRLSAVQRIALAKERMNKVVDHMLHLLAIHESNRIVVFSDALSRQIPRSRAANAFNLFRDVVHRYELIRLCIVWDEQHADTESIPTVVALIDEREIVRALAHETCGLWVKRGARVLDPQSDPVLAAEIERLNRHHALQFARRQGAKAARTLLRTIRVAKKIECSAVLRSVRNFRHKHLAHGLARTRAEVQGPAIEAITNSEVHELLERSIAVADALYCWVNGSSFDWEDARRIDRENAEALWHPCKFNLERGGQHFFSPPCVDS